MVDPEVAQIFAEIKQRVSSAQEKQTSGIAENSAPSIPKPAMGSLNRYASLPVLARTWDRLPPLVSNRTGTLARLELWIKGKFKRAFKWFTWEQVNFNAGTYHTFVELVESLNAYEQQLAETKQRIDLLREDLKLQLEQLDRQHLAIIAQLNARAEGLTQATKDLQTENQAKLSDLVTEFRLRNETLLDEQRVCFRQLSLELSESQVLHDRARRELEARVARLEAEK
jgi:hypothetical protein